MRADDTHRLSDGTEREIRGVIKNYKGRLIIVDGDTQKFESDTEAFRKITDQIDAMLYGLFK